MSVSWNGRKKWHQFHPAWPLLDSMDSRHYVWHSACDRCIYIHSFLSLHRVMRTNPQKRIKGRKNNQRRPLQCSMHLLQNSPAPFQKTTPAPIPSSSIHTSSLQAPPRLPPAQPHPLPPGITLDNALNTSITGKLSLPSLSSSLAALSANTLPATSSIPSICISSPWIPCANTSVWNSNFCCTAFSRLDIDGSRDEDVLVSWDRMAADSGSRSEGSRGPVLGGCGGGGTERARSCDFSAFNLGIYQRCSFLATACRTFETK